MSPRFGTSGLRGLASELTGSLVADYTRAFCRACETGGAVFLGRDLRDSSPRIAEAAVEAVLAEGLDVIDCGVLPTPALALAAAGARGAALMVTGSHIPADRNGLKFYTPRGEITKAEEERIGAALGGGPGRGSGHLRSHDALGAFRQRYVAAYDAGALAGLRLGIYQHSSLARDLLVDIVRALGAEAVPLARSEVFVPVDTEAVDPGTRGRLAGWAAEHRLDAILSTDGDADRPMLADATGRVVPGDVLGPLTARALGAEAVVTPVSANTLVEAMGAFAVTRTRIGSPHVIAGMARAGGRVAGYEPNGGFLLGFAADGPAGPFAPLVTRDCVLPMLAPLAAARAAGVGLAELAAALPARFTATDRVQGIPTETSAAFLAGLTDDDGARAAFFDAGTGARVDLTDGLRVTFDSGAIVHLRPSGNAPEFRVYAEAGSEAEAQDLLARHLDRVRARLLG